MAYYALLTGNIVSEVIAGRDEDDLVDGEIGRAHV
jgi:hypothetical protein